MPFTITRDLARARLPAALPPRLRERAPLLRGAGSVTLVLFRGAEVIGSREVAKALARLGPPPAGLVVAGPNFTAEAQALLAGVPAELLTEGEFFWTDQSFNTIRQL